MIVLTVLAMGVLFAGHAADVVGTVPFSLGIAIIACALGLWRILISDSRPRPLVQALWVLHAILAALMLLGTVFLWILS